MRILRGAKPHFARAGGGRWALLVAVVLTAGSLGGGLALDDYFHRARVHGVPIMGGSPLDLFSFANGRPDMVRLNEIGIIPWFGYPDLKLRFFRPISSA